MKIKEMAISKVNPAYYNPRIQLEEGDEEFEKLRKVIETYGFVQPLVLNTRTGRLVGGHQRLAVAKAMGLASVPVTEVNLNETEEKKLNLALNKVSGQWDEEALGVLLNDLKSSGDALDITGFDEIEIEELTLAFSNVDMDNDFLDFEGGGEAGEYDPDDEDMESGGEEEVSNAIVQYNIIFDDEVQQETWHSFLKMLKNEYNNDAFPSHAARIHAFLKKEALPRLNTLRENKKA